MKTFQALKHKDITVYGDGSQTRSFCYADDLIEGFIRLMNTPDDFTGPLNLGNPKEFTILEIAQKIIELTASESKIIYKDLPSDDPRQRQPNITLAREVLGWVPLIEVEEGLLKTIQYFKRMM